MLDRLPVASAPRRRSFSTVMVVALELVVLVRHLMAATQGRAPILVAVAAAGAVGCQSWRRCPPPASGAC
uniref:Putative secreted protein n=1 Tax=Anopheles triannulatus TaxID=58253 RepID=A0A2M4B614_9DIPT